MSLATGICILVLATGKLTYLMEMIGNLKSYVPIDATYLNALLKMIGITYVGQFSAGICRDAGYSSIAGQIEIFAKLSILVISMPILTGLMETIQEFLA